MEANYGVKFKEYLNTPRVYVDSKGDFWKEASSENDIYYYNMRTREASWDISLEWSLVSTGNKFYTKKKSSTNAVTVSADYGYGQEQSPLNPPLYDTALPSTVTNFDPCDFQSVNNSSSNLKTPPDLSRPIAIEPIPGTSWYIALTGTGKHFYYNHKTLKSQYNRPEDLDDNLTLEGAFDRLSEKKTILKTKDSTIAKQKKVASLIASSELNDEKFNDDLVALEMDSVHTVQVYNTTVPEKSCAEDESKRKLPYYERVKLFHELLDEKKVSVFSTYDSELIKLRDDYRFNLFSTKDRKTLFNDYLTKRVEKEKAEKHNAIKQKYESFKEFLKSVVKSSRTSYSEILVRYSNDPRFRIINKEREREALFQEYINELSLSNKNVSEHISGQSKTSYFELLSEIESLDAHTPWKRVKKVICDDKRFLEVSEDLREQWFDEYIERKVDEDKKIEMERLRVEREKASIKEREKKVGDENKRLKENLEAERRKHLQNINTNTFKELLNDMITTPNISWRDAKHLMRSDSRFKVIDNLSRHNYLEIFDKHLEKLNKKIQNSFHQLLDEVNTKINSSFDEIYPKIKNESRCKAFSKNEKTIKNEFNTYVEILHKNNGEMLQNLLLETKMIDFRFIAKAKLIPSLFDEMYETLARDPRYSALDYDPDRRKSIIEQYIRDIEKRGSGVR